ncbi:M10 family metallopeptidase [Microvirga antarctica]|uniref:M10 family metallopeptidase n=1 Tax=Microvirga antarctica TaxID=2819233 RepID=UPI001B30D30C|nr:matrixin family metalloprotease [Microvirga antarctica]
MYAPRVAEQGHGWDDSGAQALSAPAYSAGPAVRVSDFRGILSGESWVSSPTLKATAKPGFITYSFPKAMTLGDREVLGSIRDSWAPFATQDILDARAALKQWGDASGIRFLETKSNHGDIQFSWISSNSSAFAYYPSTETENVRTLTYFTSFGDISGNVYLNPAYRSYFKEDTAFKAYTLLHEVGHAIGLKHPFATSNLNKRLLSSSVDHVKATVMAYTSGDDASPTALGPLDLQAVQHIYGKSGTDGKHLASWAWNAKSEVLAQTGKVGNDVILGTSVRDVIKGMAGNDRLQGLVGNDVLIGGAGSDILIGGPGRDTFRFDTKTVSSRYADKIIDFVVTEDHIQFTRAAFAKVGAKGHLKENAFAFGTKATLDTSRVMYDKDHTGAVFYDPDGTGSQAAVKLATLSSGLNIKASHFLII